MSFLCSKAITRKDYNKSLRNSSKILSRNENNPKPTGRIIEREINGQLYRCCVDCSKATLKLFFRKHFQPLNVYYIHNPTCISKGNLKLK